MIVCQGLLIKLPFQVNYKRQTRHTSPSLPASSTKECSEYSKFAASAQDTELSNPSPTLNGLLYIQISAALQVRPFGQRLRVVSPISTLSFHSGDPILTSPRESHAAQRISYDAEMVTGRVCICMANCAHHFLLLYLLFFLHLLVTKLHCTLLSVTGPLPTEGCQVGEVDRR